MIYLDHAATSLPRLPSALAAAMRAFDTGNAGRGASRAAMDASETIERARVHVRSLVGWGTVCFTAGATAAINLALRGWRPRPSSVAIDPLAHHAVIRTLEALRIPYWVLPHDREGRVDPTALRTHWRTETQQVVLTHGSNVTGALQPVAEIAAWARAHGASVVLDAAQTVGAVPLDCEDIDAVAFGAHKALRALPGVGVLVVRDGVRLDPLITGGTGGDSAVTMPDALPWGVEAGTQNVSGIAALGAAAEASRGDRTATCALGAALRDAVLRADLSPLAHNDLPVVTFEMPGRSPADVEQMLDRVFDISVRAGLHCAPAAHAVLGTAARGAVRVSAGSTTTPSELEALTEALRAVRTTSHGC